MIEVCTNFHGTKASYWYLWKVVFAEGGDQRAIRHLHPHKRWFVFFFFMTRKPRVE